MEETTHVTSLHTPTRLPDANVLYLYKSEEGCKAIMDWYESVIDLIDIPVESQYVDTRFGPTHMLVCGPEDGRPVIMVQGVASSAPLWRHQLSALSRHYRVYALDTVGQPGRSAPHPLSFFNNEYVQWLTDVIDGLHIEKAHFIGISTGGWKLIRMAAIEPDRVDKMVLLSPMGLSHARLPWKIWFNRVMKKSKNADVLEEELTAKSVVGPRESGIGSFGVFDRQVARAMALCTRYFRMDRALKIYNPKTGKIFFFGALKVLRRFFLSESKKLIKRVKADTLILFGEHEILFNPLKVAKRVKRLLPKAEVVIIPGTGHGCIYDKPDEANRIIMDFLKQ